MGKPMKITVNFFLVAVTVCMILFVCSFPNRLYSDSSKKGAYYELKKDGRIYIFTSSQRKEDFEKSGEYGKGIIKIGHGPNGETVVFDSDKAVIEYESRQIRRLQEQVNVRAYKEFEKEGRVYVFTSPSRKAAFDQSGEPGKGTITRIGYGSRGETVIFDSDEAVKEYDIRHSKKQKAIEVAVTEDYFEIERDGRIYVFTSANRKADFEGSGEMGKSIIRIGYGPSGETVVFDSDEAVKEYDARH